MHAVELQQDADRTPGAVDWNGHPSHSFTEHDSGNEFTSNGRGMAVRSVEAVCVCLARNHAKLLCDLWQFAKVAVLRAFGLIDFPVPPNSLMRSTSSKTIRHYYGSGIRSLMPVVTAAATEGIDLSSRLTVLDFGCGVGRLLLHLTRLHPNLALHACDVNSRAVKYVKIAHPAVTATTNRSRPPLDYSDATFDWVYSVSIFSHLSEDDQRCWLSELARVIKPGGLCCLTTMGLHAVDHWEGMTAHEREIARTALKRTGLYYNGSPKPGHQRAAERISTFGSNLIGIDGSYGDMFYTEDYVRRHWDNQDFELRRWRSGEIDDLQDLVVLRRR
jgi:SAM-dependent methyltransferase